MKRISSRKNLKIVKKTLRNLTAPELENAQGGRVLGLCTLMRSACSSVEEHNGDCHMK